MQAIILSKKNSISQREYGQYPYKIKQLTENDFLQLKHGEVLLCVMQKPQLYS